MNTVPIPEKDIEYNPLNIDNEILVDDYLWLFKFDDIDNKKLLQTCFDIGNYIDDNFPPVPDTGVYGCPTSYYHGHYNLFSFPSTELYKLYNNMAKKLYSVMREDDYYIRCWVNLFEPGQNIDWHKHWGKDSRAYHGFYCVNVEGENDSYTDYLIKGYWDNRFRVLSKNGYCVFGKSEDDLHRASPWENNGYRVTIAFDVGPMSVLQPQNGYMTDKPHDLIPLIKKNV
jgi:hypothetical protein